MMNFSHTMNERRATAPTRGREADKATFVLVHGGWHGGCSFTPFAARLQSAPGWCYHELATGHDAMLTAPEELAEVLLGLCQRRREAGKRHEKSASEEG